MGEREGGGNIGKWMAEQATCNNTRFQAFPVPSRFAGLIRARWRDKLPFVLPVRCYSDTRVLLSITQRDLTAV